jgi:hypothetical protein
MLSLNLDCTIHIALFLHHNDILALCRVDKQLSIAYNQQRLWQAKVVQRIERRIESANYKELYRRALYAGCPHILSMVILDDDATILMAYVHPSQRRDIVKAVCGRCGPGYILCAMSVDNQCFLSLYPSGREKYIGRGEEMLMAVGIEYVVVAILELGHLTVAKYSYELEYIGLVLEEESVSSLLSPSRDTQPYVWYSVDGYVKRSDSSELIAVPSNATTYITYDVNDQAALHWAVSPVTKYLSFDEIDVFLVSGKVYLYAPSLLMWSTVVHDEEFDGSSLLASVGKTEETETKCWYECVSDFDILDIWDNYFYVWARTRDEVFRLEDGMSTMAIWAAPYSEHDVCIIVENA